MLIVSTTTFFITIYLASSAWCITKRSALKGFPLGVNCGSAKFDQQPANNETVQCVISDGDNVLINKGIIWENRLNEGSMDASEIYNDKEISVSVTWGNNSFTSKYLMTIIEPKSLNCSERPEIPGFNPEIGKSEEISCSATRELTGDMSKEQYNNIKTIWYHECDEIKRGSPKYIYSEGVYMNIQRRGPKSVTIRSFQKLKVVSSTFASAGVYQCVVQYKGAKVFLARSLYCVSAPESHDVEWIRANSSSFRRQLGEDLVVGCLGKASSAAGVRWSKYNESANKFDLICFDNQGKKSKTCPYDSPPSICHKATSEEIAKAHRRNGSFEATMTFRNLAYTDAGIYRCEAKSSNDWPGFNFTITVSTPVTTHNYLTVALCIVAGLLFVVMILFAIYHWKKTEFLYFYKKMFAEALESDKLITSVVYCEDAFNMNFKENPLKDVRDWLSTGNHTFYDPNDGKSFNNAGENVAEHPLRVLDNCLSVTVILTQKLLTDNTIEIFKTYAGFGDNVKRNLPIVFICNESMKKEVYANAKRREETSEDSEEKRIDSEVYITFRRFMKRNTVILWRSGDKERFNRALYVAMPKVKRTRKLEAFSNNALSDVHDLPGI